jgi:hypothetical protein
MGNSSQPNIKDAESAFLDAQAEMELFIQSFLNEWYAPIAETSAFRAWSAMPEDARMFVRQTRPEVAKPLDNLLAQGATQ